MTIEPLQVLSSDDCREGLVFRDTDEVLKDWLNVSNTSQNETRPATNQSDFALPAKREIAFEGTLRINGYAAGVIRSSEGTLIVDADGEVDADISVHNVTIYGCVRGDIRAKQTVELGGSGRVVGDIETMALSMEPGAVFEGRCIFVQTSRAADTPKATHSEATSQPAVSPADPLFRPNFPVIL